MLITQSLQIAKFQSTLPSQGATDTDTSDGNNTSISIHAPLTGSDKEEINTIINNFEFQSTLPSQGATTCRIARHSIFAISIHAPLTGSD